MDYYSCSSPEIDENGGINCNSATKLVLLALTNGAHVLSPILAGAWFTNPIQSCHVGIAELVHR